MTIREIAVAFGVDVDNASISKAESSVKGLKSLATKLLGGLAMVVSVAGVKAFVADCTEMASNVEQVQQKFDVVFDECAKGAEEWAKNFADAVGRNKNKIKEYMADNQNLLTGFGMTRDAATDMTEKMVEAALDLASFNNISDDVAINAMSKAMMGETEAAKTLGAVLNDVTRAQAMEELGLQGKYDALDQATKMQVNYRAIMDQSKDSIGDCVRSMDSYESKQRQLTAQVEEYKEYIGTMLLPLQIKWVALQVKAVKWISELTKKIIGENAEENRLVKIYDKIMSVVQKLKPAIDRMMQTLSKGAEKGRDLLKNVVDRLGGMDNALKLLALVAGAFAIAMNWSKIIDGAKNLLKLLNVIGKVFSVAGLKVLAITAIIIVLALIVEDFINFLLGNDSVIGTIFDKAGIGADNARETIFNAWQTVKVFLTETWDTIKTAAEMLFGTIKDFFDEHSESIKENFMRAWGIIKTFLNGVWTFITQLASTLFGNAEDDINGSTNSTKDGVLGVWQAILDALSACFDAIYETASTVFNAVATVIEVIFCLIQAFWNNWGSDILAWFKVMWDSLGGIINGFLEVVKGVANFISAVLKGDWQGAWEAIKQIFTGVWEMIINAITGYLSTMNLVISMGIEAIKTVWNNIWNTIWSFIVGVWNNIVSHISEKVTAVKNSIVNGFNSAVDYIKGLGNQAYQWGADMINGIVKGITDKISSVKSAVSGVANSIKSYLHFSVPDVGPLTDYESWMPDFMKGLASGIDDNSNLVLGKIKQLSQGISTLVQASVAKPVTAQTSTVNNRTSSVVQNVDISNSYSGGTVETQRSVSKTMKKSATDATTSMARALAYVRG